MCKLRSFLNDADHQVISLGQLVLDKHPDRHYKWCQFDGIRPLFSCLLQYHILSNSSALLSRPDVAKSVIQLLWSDLTARSLGPFVVLCFRTSRDKGRCCERSCSLLQVKQLIRQLYNSFRARYLVSTNAWPRCFPAESESIGRGAFQEIGGQDT